MIAGYTAVLCSPEFLCLDETPGPLDDHALAARLAYFLWNSPPDDGAARGSPTAGQLHDPEVLRGQADRLLDDPKSRRFVDAFLDYWLDLRKIGATSPDATLYPDYYLDDLLAESAVEETRRLLRRAAHGDLPARNLVASDFTILNERLADALRPARRSAARRSAGRRCRRAAPRGGLLTQASVLKVTANGTTTSPVLRGAWVMERDPRQAAAPAAARRAGRRARHPRGDHDPRAVGEAPTVSLVRRLPREDRPAGLRPGELRRDGRVPRPLPGARTTGPERRAGLRQERPAVRLPAARRSTRRRPARRPGLPRRPRAEAAAAGRRAADRPQPRRPARHVRHRRRRSGFGDRAAVERILDAHRRGRVRRPLPGPEIVQSELFRSTSNARASEPRP